MSTPKAIRRGFLCALTLAVLASAQTNTDRTLTIVNSCPNETMRIGVNGGFVQDCGTGNTCPAGTACLTTKTPPGCFWTLPDPSTGSAVLGSGQRATYQLTNPAINENVVGHGTTQTSINVKWSGNIYAAAGCQSDGTNCTTGMCPQSSGGVSSIVPCASGVGPQGPVTLAEFTFSSTGADFYDVSVINGVNVPISMGPTSSTPPAADPYFCRTAGNANASRTGLQACSWTFTPPAGQARTFAAVAPGGAACPATAPCSDTTQVCGMPVQLGTTSISPSCGKQVGWWTADELCVFTANAMGNPIQCAAAVSGQGQNVNLYQCNGANAQSCYNPDSSTNTSCCGCPSWSVNGKALKANMSCAGQNASWVSQSQPFLAFVKNACPTAYSFPFDDATSTFTCTSPNPSDANPNNTNYTITFCPGGKRGIPAVVTKKKKR